MGRNIGDKDIISRKYKHCFSRQYLQDHGVSITRGNERILGPVPKLYKIVLPNTRYYVGQAFVQSIQTKPLTSYEQLQDLGLVIVSRRIQPHERWDMGQQVVYELKYKNRVSDHLGKFPGGKYGATAEYDPLNKAVRLIGVRTGPLGYGPWTPIERDTSNFSRGGGKQIQYTSYGERSDEIINNQVRDWLGMEHEETPVMIKEAAFMISKSNEIVCFPNIPDMPSILITGMKGCLTEDALIDMPRDMLKYPKGVPIRDLVGRKNFYVYSFNIKEKKLECRTANSCEFVKNADIYEIELVTGQKICATEDHPFLTMNGEYKKLKDLIWCKGKFKYTYLNKETGQRERTDRLRMFSRPTIPNKDNIIKIDFNPIQQGETSYMHSAIEHRFIAEQVLGDIAGKLVHHKNGNHFDHNPENLELTTHISHFHKHDMEKYAFLPGNKYRRTRILTTKRKERVSQTRINHALKKSYFILPEYEESRKEYRKKLSSIHKEHHGWAGGVIKEIRYVGKRDVFDIIGVEGNHNYIANGFVVSNSGKSFCLHSLVSRFFWKPEYKFKIVILNDSSRETGTWCYPNNDGDQIMMLKKLNERPLPLPTVYLHPKVKDEYEKLYMGSVGFDVSIPFKEIVENHKDYLQIEGSQRYFNKIKDKLKNAETENMAEGILDLMGVGMGIPQNSANKIRAEFEMLFDSKMTDISSKKQYPWSVSVSPNRRFNPLTACVHAGVLPVLESEYISNQRSMLSIYFTYFVKDLFMRQKQDPDFQKQRSEIMMVIDECHNISQKGMHSGADMLLRRCVREGRPRRIGTLLATQKFSELPDIIKDNSTYLICFKNPGEAAAIANQYKMGKQAVEFITDLEKHECLAYTTEYFIVYDTNGKRRKSKPNEIFVGRSLPPYSMHKRPKAEDAG